MPWYDFVCESAQRCGYFDDMFIPIETLDEAVCPSCSGPIRRLVRPIRTVGPMPSKPVTIRQIDKSFESPAELRAWHKANPDAKFVAPDSKHWRDKVDRVRNKAEAKARKEGFRDLEDKQAKRWGKAPDGRNL